jgi:hypothetical protein
MCNRFRVFVLIRLMLTPVGCATGFRVGGPRGGIAAGASVGSATAPPALGVTTFSGGRGRGWQSFGDVEASVAKPRLALVVAECKPGLRFSEYSAPGFLPAPATTPQRF